MREGNDFDFEFTGAFDVFDEATLDSLIANHEPPPEVPMDQDEISSISYISEGLYTSGTSPTINSATWQIAPMNAFRRPLVKYSQTNPNQASFQIIDPGTYEIEASVTLDQTASNTRSNYAIRLTTNQGGSYTYITGTRKVGYIRNAATDQVSIKTKGTFELSAGSSIRVEINRHQGPGTAICVLNDCNYIIRRIG